MDETIDSPICAKSLERQIVREGERWGLVPDMGADEQRYLSEALLDSSGGEVETTLPDGSTVRFEVDEGAVLDALDRLKDSPSVGVARVDYYAEVHHGLGEIVRNQRIRLCTIDDEHPFSGALANRVMNGEHDLTARAREGRRLEKVAQQNIAAERRKEAKRLWRGRNTITVLPSGIVPAGLAERARRNRR